MRRITQGAAWHGKMMQDVGLDKKGLGTLWLFNIAMENHHF
jgi:hypothetical protein